MSRRRSLPRLSLLVSLLERGITSQRGRGIGGVRLWACAQRVHARESCELADAKLCVASRSRAQLRDATRGLASRCEPGFNVEFLGLI